MEINDDPENPDQPEEQYPSPGTICSHSPENIGKSSKRRSSSPHSPTVPLHSQAAETVENPRETRAVGWGLSSFTCSDETFRSINDLFHVVRHRQSSVAISHGLKRTLNRGNRDNDASGYGRHNESR